jgi:4-carboxymuconolactone decarboxylase
MDRVPLLTERDGLTPRQRDLFDWIVGSRGRMIRPYEVLLHVPGLARPAAELGHEIRFEGALSDRDRELAILTSARSHRCGFEWESHVTLARDVGVREEAIAAIAVLDDAAVDRTALSPDESVIVDFVTELCSESTVSDATYAAAEGRLGTEGVVELSAVVGYYTFLAYVMNAAGAG